MLRNDGGACSKRNDLSCMIHFKQRVKPQRATVVVGSAKRSIVAVARGCENEIQQNDERNKITKYIIVRYAAHDRSSYRVHYSYHDQYKIRTNHGWH